MVIDFSSANFAGPTTAINIAKELKALREGKRVIAFNDRLSTTSYLMASQASEIWVHPVGSVSVRGVGGMRNYNKGLFDNLKITIHNYSQGDFKSATEPSWRSDMSENDRMQREAILFPIWDEMKALMAEGRGIESSDIQPLRTTTLASLVRLPLETSPTPRQTILLMAPNHFLNSGSI